MTFKRIECLLTLTTGLRLTVSPVIMYSLIQKIHYFIHLFCSHLTVTEGGVRGCGDAVLRYFWFSFAVIFILSRVLQFQNAKRFEVITTFRLRFLVKKVSAVMAVFKTVTIHGFGRASQVFCLTTHQGLLYQFTI